MPPLTTRVRDVYTHLFDPADSGATALDPRLQMRVRALRVLAHAEIEDEIESACMFVSAAIRGTPGASLPKVVVIGGAEKRPKDGLRRVMRTVQSPMTGLLDEYDGFIQANHGIKRNNLERLLVPLNVDLSALRLDVNTLHDYGDKRGQVAHSGAASGAITVNLPSAELTLATTAAAAGDTVAAAIRAQAAHFTAHSSATAPAKRSILGRIVDFMAGLIP